MGKVGKNSRDFTFRNVGDSFGGIFLEAFFIFEELTEAAQRGELAIDAGAGKAFGFKMRAIGGE